MTKHDGNARRRVLALAIALGVSACVAWAWGLSWALAGGLSHKHLYLSGSSALWLHVASDATIVISYGTILTLLVYFVRKRRDLPFSWAYCAFGLFLAACGLGRFLDIVSVWFPLSGAPGLVRGFAALASVSAVCSLASLLPKALSLPGPERLRLAVAELCEERSGRKRAEAELARKADELERAAALLAWQRQELERLERLAAMGRLAASAGHELRNPLAAAQNAVAYISKRVLSSQGAAPSAQADARVVAFFGIADRELRACGKIVADMLEFARDRRPNRQPCELRGLVDEAIEIVPKGAVRVENLVGEGLPSTSVDRDQIRQVLVNLIQNAVDATPEGSPHPVTVEAEGGGREPLRITVTDKGRGIPDDQIAKVGEPWFTTKARGTGLGLAIVKSIVRSHEGELEIASRAGEATAFTIQLPADRPAGAGPAAA